MKKHFEDNIFTEDKTVVQVENLMRATEVAVHNLVFDATEECDGSDDVTAASLYNVIAVAEGILEDYPKDVRKEAKKCIQERMTRKARLIERGDQLIEDIIGKLFGKDAADGD